MKLYLYIFIIFIISISAVKAQKPITLVEDSMKFGTRFFPGFWLTIPETKPEIIKKNWTKAIEKGTKSKVSSNKYEMTLFGAIISEISDGSINIMSMVVDGDSLTKLFVSVETKRDVFIERTSDEYENLSTYLNKFAKGQYILVAKDQLSVEESKLKSLEKGLKSSRKVKARFEKNIQASKVSISEQHDKITGIKKELEILNDKIDYSSSLLSTMDDGDAKKAKKSELKDLQKKKKTLLKSINTSENKISKSNTAISDNTQNIKMNEADQKELTDKITQQKLTVNRFQQKLKTIEDY